MAAGLFAELLGQAEQDRLPQRSGGQLGHVDASVARAGPPQQLPYDVPQTEHRQQRHSVRKALVEARLVGMRRHGVGIAESVEQRVGRLVGDDVVGKAGEHRLTVGAREVAEEQPVGVLGIVRVGLGEGVRGRVELVPAEAPGHAPAQRRLEPRQQPHHDGVDVLGVEARVSQQLRVRGLGVRVAVVAGLVWGVQHALGRVVVHHMHPRPSRPGAELLVGDFHVRSQDSPVRVQNGWVLRNEGQLPDRRHCLFPGA